MPLPTVEEMKAGIVSYQELQVKCAQVIKEHERLAIELNGKIVQLQELIAMAEEDTSGRPDRTGQEAEVEAVSP